MASEMIALWRDQVDADQYVLGALRPHYKHTGKLVAQAYALLFVDFMAELFGGDVAAKARVLKPGEFLIIHGIGELYGERRAIPRDRLYLTEDDI